MKTHPTELPGVVVIEPTVHRDDRGFFLESYRAAIQDGQGMHRMFVQDNHSFSRSGVLRGLHLQVRRPQAKLVRVIKGEIFDVAVDVRRGSPTFKRSIAVRLSGDNLLACYIPEGFAHGFCVVSDEAHVEYKCSDYYDAGGELGIAWNDPALGIEWPIENPVLSARDRTHQSLSQLMDLLPTWDQITSNELSAMLQVPRDRRL